MSAGRILRTLDFGLMMSIAYPLRRDEREAVAHFLGVASDESDTPAIAACRPGTTIMSGSPRNWAGWAPANDNTRFQAEAAAAMSIGDVGRLRLKWAYGFSGDVIAFSAPTIRNGTVFVGSAGGIVQALDMRSGCVHWVYRSGGPVRAAITITGQGPAATLLFGDQNGWVHALDARSGQPRWKQQVEAHEATRLTGSIVVHEDVVFVPAASWEETRALDPDYPCCTFRGSLTALRLRDGSRRWKTYMVDPPGRTGVTKHGTETLGPSGAGIWSAPTIDAKRRVVYVTTGDNYSHPATATSDAVIALALDTGRIVWIRQTTPQDVYTSACGPGGPNCPASHGPDHDFGASAMLVRTPDAREVLIAGQKSGVVYALDPSNKGAVLWRTRVGQGGINGGVQWGMATDGTNIYVPVSDVGRRQNVTAAAPVGAMELDPNQGGGLTALRVSDGHRVWLAPAVPCNPPQPGCSPAQPSAVTAIPGVVFSGAMDGHIRAFATEDGRLLWDFDTRQTYATVNGALASGGSLDGAGPVVAGRMLFVNSGYPRFGGAPGNVLLAFGIAE
jgi:polyvinyl alcohol dehydrogenase (cytochrome)